MFIIDGHNLLHTILKTGEASEATSDLKLCGIVGRYLQLIGRPGVMIFDGAGPQDKSGFDEVGNLEVLFAGAGADADTAIEDKIRSSTAPKRVTVVSSDRRLRRAARTRRCASLKSDVFWEDVRKQLNRRRSAPEPPAKRHGLSESETDQWLDAFGL